MKILFLILIILTSGCICSLIALSIEYKFIGKPQEKELKEAKVKINQLENEIKYKIPYETELKYEAYQSEYCEKNKKKTVAAISQAAQLEGERRKLINNIYKIKQIAENREECLDIEMVADFMIEQAEIRNNNIKRWNND